MNVDLTQDVEVGQLYLHEFYLRLIWRHFSLSFPPPFLFFFFSFLILSVCGLKVCLSFLLLLIIDLIIVKCATPFKFDQIFPIKAL